MLRALSLVAVLVIGWAAALLLLYWGLRLGLAHMYSGPDDPEPIAPAIMFNTGLALVPATPAAMAWLAARYRWRVAAWAFGVLAAAFAIYVGFWVLASLS
jgi:hypothetical protein